jgi:hypothetical protein
MGTDCSSPACKISLYVPYITFEGFIPLYKHQEVTAQFREFFSIYVPFGLDILMVSLKGLDSVSELVDFVCGHERKIVRA